MSKYDDFCKELNTLLLKHGRPATQAGIIYLQLDHGYIDLTLPMWHAGESPVAKVTTPFGPAINVELDPTYETRMMAMFSEIKTSPEKQQLISNAVATLISVSKADKLKWNDENRKGLLPTDPDLKSRVRDVGVRLHHEGGLALMQFTHGAIVELLPHEGRFLEFAWDGIGEWLA